MYDWPQVAAQTDAFWFAIRGALAAAGIAAPTDLDRLTPLPAQWRAPHLLLSQTCGWPLVHHHQTDLAVVARPTYAAEGCGAGTYRSAIVARRDAGLAELARGTVAVNGHDSLSGYWALAARLAGEGIARDELGEMIETGSHRASLRAVADGKAGLAAIDCVSWRLAVDHEPVAAGLHVIGWTAEMPALSFVTSVANAQLSSTLLAVLETAIATAPQPLLTGVTASSRADYDVVAELTEQARAAGY